MRLTSQVYFRNNSEAWRRGDVQPEVTPQILRKIAQGEKTEVLPHISELESES